MPFLHPYTVVALVDNTTEVVYFVMYIYSKQLLLIELQKMMNKRFGLWVLLLVLLLAANGTAWATDKEDTLANNTEFLMRADSLRVADSVRLAALEVQLNALQSTDNKKKEELLAEIEQLKNAEQEKRKEQKRQVDSLKQFVNGYPVAPFHDTLLMVYSRLGAWQPEARAAAIVEKIKRLEKDHAFNPDSLQVIESEQSTDVVFADLIVLTVTDRDAVWLETNRGELALKYRDTIKQAIKIYRDETSIISVLKDIGWALVVIGFAGLLIYFVNKLFRFTKTKLHSLKGKYLKGISVRGYELFTADNEVRVFEGLNNILRWIAILSVLYLMMPALFSIFPWTRHFSDTLLGYFLSPIKNILLGIWNYLPNLITIIVVLFVFRYVIKAVSFLKYEIQEGKLVIPGFYSDWATPTYQIIRILLFAFMIIVIFPYLPGSDSPVFKGVSVFLGVLFTFGSSGSLSNIIAGLVLTYMRAYKIGDRVKIGEVTGDIIQKTLLVTRIRTIKNEDITIPNSTIMNSHTINYTSSSTELGLIVHTTVTIGYDVPWRQVHQLLIAAATATDMILEEPKPFVLQTSLDDFYVSYQINAYTHEASKQAVIYSQLHQHIQDKFNEAGVEIMSPHYKALRDGNLVTIPTDYLPGDYTAPGFKMDTGAKGNEK
jgi:small-conductance mechanosensitive channel